MPPFLMEHTGILSESVKKCHNGNTVNINSQYTDQYMFNLVIKILFNFFYFIFTMQMLAHCLFGYLNYMFEEDLKSPRIDVCDPKLPSLGLQHYN